MLFPTEILGGEDEMWTARNSVKISGKEVYGVCIINGPKVAPSFDE